MKLGFTFDEKAISRISISDWISKAHSLGASAIELAPDKNILPVSQYLEIAGLAADLGMELNYHIPYFASEHYSVSGFYSDVVEGKKVYAGFVELLEQISLVTGNSDSTIVVHGEEFASSSEKSLVRTVELMEYISDLLESKNLNHRVAIESLGLGITEKVGNSRPELLEVLDRLSGDRFGICLDICHDSMNYFPSKPNSDSDFYEKIIYSHIHGFDFSTGKKHMSLCNSQINFLDQILALKQIKPEVTLNIESLSDFTGSSYLEELFCDISTLSKLV